MKVKALYIITFLLISITIWAQNASQDFYRINKAYKESKNISMLMQYRLYKNWTDNKAYDVKFGETKRYEQYRYNKFDQIESMLTSKYVLTVNHQLKLITLMDASIKEEAAMKDNDIISLLDSTFVKRCKRIEFKKIGVSEKCYTLYPVNGNYEKVTIYFSTKTYFITRLIMFSGSEQSADGNSRADRQKPRMEIDYNKIITVKNFNEEEFTYKRFLMESNRKLVCRKEYKNYQLVNQLHQ